VSPFIWGVEVAMEAVKAVKEYANSNGE